jgi:uncharacterized protein (TIGR03066 family)
MRFARVAVLALLAIFFAGSAVLLHAEDKPKDLIVGKWEPTKAPEGLKLVIEFTKDGKIAITGKAGDKDLKANGTYKFTDDNTMQTEITFEGKKDSKKVKIIKVTKDELVTRDEGDKDDEKFKRVK